MLSLFKLVQPIAYSGPFPAVHATRRDHTTQMTADLRTKAIDWQYEGEWRVFDYSGPGLKRFEPHVLSGVIFGCRTPKRDLDFVRRAVARGARRPRL